MDSHLKQIDFSEGIKSSEINHNFEALQSQFDRERKSVGGRGIASGLDIEPIINGSEFKIKISEASIITNEGEEIHIPDTVVDIELPKLLEEIEYLSCNSSNEIELKHIPYSISRRGTIETLNHLTPNTSGMTIKYPDSIAIDDYIRIRNINKRTLALSGITKRDVIITYHYTNKRVDTVYIDNNNEIKIISSVTSPSPTAKLPEDYKYLIALIEVDGMYNDKSEGLRANIEVVKDLRFFRNIYTDSDNVLWICGTKFEDLQIIHFHEPKEPSLNTMWYDNTCNQLKVWKAVDDVVYMDEYEITTNYEDNPNINKDYSTNMYYSVGDKQLEVYINNVKLFDQEYSELVSGTPAEILMNVNGKKSNVFRVYADLNVGDKLSFKITGQDGHEMWAPVNHSSFVKAKEIKLFSPDSEAGGKNYYGTSKAIALGKDADNYPLKYQYFIFDRVKDINMLFTPGVNELSIMFNQTILHSDQFEELVIYDLFDGTLPESVRDAASNYFGWDDLSLEKINEEYENVGIGFKLLTPIDVDLDEEDNGATDVYIEAIVERRVNDAPLKRKFQRNAAFSKESSITVGESRDIDITDCYYRYGEYQLEVFVNGLKILKDLDYVEGTDLSDQNIVDDDGVVTGLAPRRRGAKTKQFTLLKDFKDQLLTYRVTTNIYSYDHVTELLNELEFDIVSSAETINALYSKIESISDTAEEALGDIQAQLESMQNLADGIDDMYVKNDDTLSVSQMPASIVQSSIQSLDHINKAVTYTEGTSTYSIKDECREEDFILVIKRDVINNTDKMLIRDVDYTIYNSYGEASVYEDTILSIQGNMANMLNTGDILLLTGVKIGKIGRLS